MTSREKTVYNALPKLPGFQFSELQEPHSHGRRQLCSIGADGERTVKESPAAMDLMGGGGAAASQQAGGAACGIPVAVILHHFPQWRTLDNKVLRFFGYYTEDVVDSPIERSRVRKLVLHYFISDGTMTVTETPAVVNSGLQHGVIVSRYKPDHIDALALSIGSSVECRGLVLHLVDCDAATREFYEVMGIPQPDEPLDYPYDTFEDTMTRQPAPMDEQHIHMRRVIEVQAAVAAGTHASLMTPDERTKARNFFEHDRDVLRFYAVWEKRCFRIHLYRADQSIAVLFDKAENDGRDPYPVFLRRRPVPRDARNVLLQTDTLNRPQGAAPPLLGAEDFYTGATVMIFTRPFFIYDCDAATRAYMRTLGVDMTAVPRPPTEGDEITVGKRQPRLTKEDMAKAAASVTAGKSIGASTMVFDDTAAEKDAMKLTRYAQDVFRFSGHIVQPRESDVGRRFLVSYYLADDTVSVYELPVRNSGHLGGVIFSRRRVPGIENPMQLSVGGSVCLEGVNYGLDEMDERTREYVRMGMPNMPEIYFKMNEIVDKVRQMLCQRFARVPDAFRHYASSSTMGLSEENVNEVLRDAELRLTPAEKEQLMKRIDGDSDGWVSLAEFTEQLMGQTFVSDFKPKAPLPAMGAGPAATVPRGPIQSAGEIARRTDAVAAGEAALRKFLTLIEARRTLAIRSFRSTGESTYDGNVAMADFVECLNKRLKVAMSDEEQGALLYKFYFAPNWERWTERRLTVQEIQRILLL